jgi:iron(III) transport system permease protein
MLILVAFAVVWFERKTRKQAQYENRTKRAQPIIRLEGRRLVAALSFLAALVGASVLLPSSVLLTWLGRGLAGGQEIGSLVAEAARSFGVSIAAAVLAAVVAVPVAMVIVRERSLLGSTAETATWMAYGLPHIAMGLAMVTFALEFAPFLYQTTTLLIVAYVAMFLPQTVGAVSDALRRISSNLEEASRSLGRSSLATTWRITLPLLRPGMIAGGSLVFLTSMKELPATLLLRPNEFDTLAIRIWAATGEGFYTRASAAALILLAVSAIPLTLVTIRDLAR